MASNSEGKGTLGCIFSLVLIVTTIFIGVEVGPPYFAYKSLEADVSTEVSRAGAHFFSNEQLVQIILDVARKNEILLKSEDVKVERIAGQVHVSIHYQVPVDLGFLEHTFDFNIKASSFVGAL